MDNTTPTVDPPPAPAETAPAAEAQSLTEIKIKDILVLDELQARVKMDQETVEDYALVLQSGKDIPCIDVVKLTDGEHAGKYAVIDGFHRLAACKKLKVKTMHVSVHEGTVADAIDMATSANQDHGLRRSNKDKRRAVEMAIALDNRIGRKRSDRQIAQHVGVHNSTVSEIRAELSGKKKPAPAEEEAPTSVVTNEGEKPKRAIDHDRLGIPIDNLDLAMIFQDAESFDQIKEWTDQIIADLERLSQAPAGAGLDMQTIKFDMSNVAKSIDFARPYTLCPFGPGCDENCKACRGRHWIPKSVFDRLDQAVKDAHMKRVQAKATEAAEAPAGGEEASTDAPPPADGTEPPASET